jgi:hypothetical protein
MTRPMTDSEIYDYIESLSHDLAEARDRIEALEKRVKALEGGTPQARQLQYEADIAMADAGYYDRHGDDCDCPYCGTDEDREG